jgi:tRNA-dihydrouridine synthase B
VAAMKGETQAPVSVKLRSGWDLDSLNYLETATAAVAGGASLVTLHPRTRSQGFGGKAAWDHIRILKNTLEVPVIGSGDLFRPEDALQMLALTGCDGVMFARGALGNPFVFARGRALLCGEPFPDPVPSSAKLYTALEQLRRCMMFKNEERACKEMRKHFCYYTRGIPGGAELRKQIVAATRYEKYESVVKEYLQRSDGLDKRENPIE